MKNRIATLLGITLMAGIIAFAFPAVRTQADSVVNGFLRDAAGNLDVNCIVGCSGGGGSVPTGPAGTPNTSVVTVQGITNGTILSVNTPAPAPTVSPGLLIGVTQGGPAAPTAVNGVNLAVIDPNGVMSSQICDATNSTHCAAVSTGGTLFTGVNSIGAVGVSIGDTTVPVNISTATTTQLVALVASDKIAVTSYSLYIVSGTTPTFSFVYGTGTNCATGQTALTGAFGGLAASDGQLFNSPSGTSSVFRVPASKALCIVTGGTTPNIQGYVTYSQAVGV